MVTKTDQNKEANAVVRLAKPRVAEATIQVFQPVTNTRDDTFGPVTVDKLFFDKQSKYCDVIKECRFYYRHDPLAATVINKVVDIAINELVVTLDKTVSVTEKSIFEAVAKDVAPFMRKAALEYLITGLVVPEISLTRVRITDLRNKGIKRLNSLLYPTSMWVRDSANIEINRPLLSDKESYFIKKEGEYVDGTADRELYLEIVKLYPEFVQLIKEGETKVRLDNPLIVKGNSLEDSSYPIPYLTPALESLKHKRNLRRMDYALAARVISAIMQVKVGSDEFPLTEDQEDILTDLEQQLQWQRNNDTSPLERSEE